MLDATVVLALGSSYKRSVCTLLAQAAKLQQMSLKPKAAEGEGKLEEDDEEVRFNVQDVNRCTHVHLCVLACVMLLDSLAARTAAPGNQATCILRLCAALFTAVCRSMLSARLSCRQQGVATLSLSLPFSVLVPVLHYIDIASLALVLPILPFNSLSWTQPSIVRTASRPSRPRRPRAATLTLISSRCGLHCNSRPHALITITEAYLKVGARNG